MLLPAWSFEKFAKKAAGTRMWLIGELKNCPLSLKHSFRPVNENKWSKNGNEKPESGAALVTLCLFACVCVCVHLDLHGHGQHCGDGRERQRSALRFHAAGEPHCHRGAWSRLRRTGQGESTRSCAAREVWPRPQDIRPHTGTQQYLLPIISQHKNASVTRP